ncbi:MULTISPECIES: DUF5707 domain-containing protein [unclassified Streptomyces]|uniref:DUF5707 domain-containing protein n=1 Tax=unclassified Streptomyces TaxID=2593676 RepID=UPI0001C1CF65|nr:MULTISPECIES: DUF5707 domain-containing protein [unclassified Streptomyces]AEN11615.1 conserved hypothetical protein [Streptomyces sp. SirexAA-E]MYR66501.1 calcium-binding protein [Streptomyces sp. SID4939]MYS04561.1 calcium-binding protein [Streptomyces sp. SID4940]MYT61863.1 calcium-binding protein [Streptomyces sp. SID8357]MYT85233.1 calcium-binding protein [Streptomyces sp. SID8360]
MRIRATVAVASGALALSALAVPAAQADGGRSWTPDLGLTAPQQAPAKERMAARALTVNGDLKITKAVVNGGKPIVVGTTAPKKVSVVVTATDDSGIADVATALWIGGDIESDDSFGFPQNEKKASCKAVNATTSTCTLTVTVDPGWLINSDATTWKVAVAALSKDGQDVDNTAFAKTKLQRLSKLTVNAAPEPVKKGKTLTVTGKLSRANWETGTYKGYAGQSVKLQFRKKNSKTYTTVKTLKTSNTGTLKTTVKASVDGYWRYTFAGTSTTPAVTAAGDFVDVK